MKEKIKNSGKNCKLCGCKFIFKNKKQYGKKGSEHHISRHHFFPKRFNKYFSKKEVQRLFNIKDVNQKLNICYECHEEMIHNIVLSPQAIEKLYKKMKGKNIKERILMLHKQLLK